MATVQTSLRLDENQFREAKEILSKLGMNFTEAVNIFTNLVVLNRGLPFSVKIPNEETETVLREIRSGDHLEEISIDQLHQEADQK